MLDYIVKFNKLPPELKDEISSPAVMAAIDELEEHYRVELASLIMKVMAKDILFGSLADYFVEEYRLDRLSAEQLQAELAGRVFFKVADYLGIDLETVLSAAPEPASEDADLMSVSARPAAAPASGIQGAQFFFSPDDEEEIRKLSDNLGRPPEVNTKLVDEKLEAILKEANINFGSAAVADRFKQIVRTYLKGIRGRLDTKLTLTKAFDAGGLNFDEESAEKIMALSDRSEALAKAEKMKPPAKIAVPEDKLAGLKAVGAADLEYDLAKEMEKRQAAKAEAVKPLFTPSRPASPPAGPGAPVKPAPPKLPPAKKPVPSGAGAKEAPAAKPAAEPEKLALKRPLETSGGKKKMEDVKYVPRTSGPVDELGLMDLVAFRRMDKEPQLASAKIKEKIKTLEEEQYSKRSEAIKAWRQSPVNRLYLAVGEEAMTKNKPVDIIIEERKSGGQDTLTGEEFEAIMNLNRDLRF